VRRLIFVLFLIPQSEAEFEVPEGLEVTLWAESPHLFNPTNIDIDARGRIWVAEGINYRNTHKRPGMKQHPEGDRIVILEDANGDGKCDSSKVFVQSPDLLVPLGIAVLGDTVLVSCSPSVIRYRVRDDKPHETEIFLKKFGGRDHDHGVHAFVGGPDGRLYFNTGNVGPHMVADKSGWTLRSGSYVGGGRNRKSDDGRVWVGGLALRIDPDGDKLTVLAHNFRNNFELSLDSYGNIWQSDNDDDGNQSCRFTWVMPGGNYGYSSNDGGRAWNVDQRPGQSIQTAHWHQEDPGVCPTVEITGAGGPTGVAVYEGDLMPKYRGAVFGCDAGRSVVFGYVPKPDGAGYRFERFTFLASKGEKKNRFRPSDVAVGIDGAIYVSDWYDPVVGGHDMKDKAGYGRILRIAPKDVKPTIRTGLDSPAVNVRFGKKDRALLDSPDPILRARPLARGQGDVDPRA
jgi:putative membrane-bound dehydrogenase-like protein